MLSCFSFAAAALLSLFCAPSVAVPLSKRSIAGPVFPNNFPDPSIIEVSAGWVAFATNNGRQHVPYAYSDDFNSWTLADGWDALPEVGAWSNGKNVWAPDVFELVCIPHPPRSVLENRDGELDMPKRTLYNLRADTVLTFPR